MPYMVDNQAIVIPETIDAVRALANAANAGESAGDFLFATSALVLALMSVGHNDWPAARFKRVAAVAVALGLGYTIFSEWLNEMDAGRLVGGLGDRFVAAAPMDHHSDRMFHVDRRSHPAGQVQTRCLLTRLRASGSRQRSALTQRTILRDGRAKLAENCKAERAATKPPSSGSRPMLVCLENAPSATREA